MGDGRAPAIARVPYWIMPALPLAFADYRDLCHAACVSPAWAEVVARDEYWLAEARRLGAGESREGLKAWYSVARRWDPEQVERRRSRPFRISVGVRMKPPSGRRRDPDQDQDQDPAQQAAPSSSTYLARAGTRSLVARKGGSDTTFSFNRVLGPTTTQQGTFDAVARGAVDEVLNGVDATVFCYGQTGAGKTHSMFGPDRALPTGMAPAAARTLFRRLGGTRFTVGVSFEEVYNEKVFDLLGGGGEAELPSSAELAAGGGRASAGAVQPCASADDVLRALRRGMRRRHQFATKMNARSSRSHAIARLWVLQREPEGGQGRELESVLALVDLAGSERLKRSGAAGDRLKEARHINLSLHSLQRCVGALAARAAHVPYRDAVLTRLMQRSLSGGARTSLLVCISSDAADVDESVSSLWFGQQAATVALEPTVRAPRMSRLDRLHGELQHVRALMQRMSEAWNSKSAATRAYEASMHGAQPKRLQDLPLYQRPMIARQPPMHRWTNRFADNPELEAAYQEHALKENLPIARRALSAMLTFYLLFMAHNFVNLFDDDEDMRDASIEYFQLVLPPLLPIPLAFAYARQSMPRMQNGYTFIVLCLGTSLVAGGVHSLTQEWALYVEEDMESILDTSACFQADTDSHTLSEDTVSGWQHVRLHGTTRELMEAYLRRVIMPLVSANVNLIRPVGIIALAPLIRLDFVHCLVLALLVSTGYSTVILANGADTSHGKFLANEALVVAAVPALSVIMLLYARQLERFARAHFVRRQRAEQRAHMAEQAKMQTTLENQLLKERLEERESGKSSTFSLDAPMTRIVSGLKDVYDNSTDKLDPAARATLEEAIFSLTANSNVYQTDVAARLDGIDSDTRAWAVSLMGQDDYERLRNETSAGGALSSGGGGLDTRTTRSSVLHGLAASALLPSVRPADEAMLRYVSGAVQQWEFDGLAVAERAENRPLFYTAAAVFQRHRVTEVLPIPRSTAVNFLHMVDAGYQPNPYHNSAHAADVVASIHWLIAVMNDGAVLKSLTSREVFAAVVAAAIHDFNHPGRTNAYLVKTRAQLAMIYSDSSVLERMHLAHAFSVTKRPNCDVFAGFSDRRYQEVRKAIVELVLITDFAAHLVVQGKLKAAVVAPQTAVRHNPLFIMQVLIKVADLGHTAKRQGIHAKWTARLVEEFFLQGDAERAENIGISPFMDRHNENTPHNQIGFFQFVTVPFFEVARQLLGGDFEVPMARARHNLALWQEAQEQGLTRMDEIRAAIFDRPVPGEAGSRRNSRSRSRAEDSNSSSRRAAEQPSPRRVAPASTTSPVVEVRAAQVAPVTVHTSLPSSRPSSPLDDGVEILQLEDDNV